ncbi:serine/threonine-protein kinase STY17 [Pelomyxa schiedti]|nr:serine/threonine-protein kinase STY17 [Pelomyxa schiedti]
MAMTTALSEDQQYEAMRVACRSGVMPELPSPTWDINTPIDGHGWTMLHFACSYGHESLVWQLLDVGASRSPPIDPNKTDRDGDTPLCVAACGGNEAVVRMLVERPDVDVNKGCPLVTTCVYHHIGVVVALLECPRVDANTLCFQKEEVRELHARNKELMEMISTLEEEVAKNLKIYCDQRESDEQRLHDMQHHTNHVMSHVEQGEGPWSSFLLPENSNNNKNCKRSQVKIAFEDLPSFNEIVCGLCPLQMVVKLIISRKFGVEPTQQLIFIVGSDNSSGVEELLSDPSRTLEEIQQQQVNGSTNRVVSLQVRIKSSMTIQEKDLKVVSTLGVGSYGTVFKCSFFLRNNTAPTTFATSSETTTTFVAVKSLHESIQSEFNITQFQKEALLSSSLRHPNIVRCLGTCTTSTGSLWIVSELMELSLRQLLHHKSLTFVDVVAVSSGIAKGMTALHMRNYMHRDLSSNNVLLDSCGTPKVADFGMSRALAGGCGPRGTFTKGAGTPIYLSPQMHTQHYGIKGDMWEFAVLLSELLQGTAPAAAVPRAAIQVHEFLMAQRASLSPPEVAELDRICRDPEAGDFPVAECLSRRIAIISALRSEPKMNNVNRVCVGQFSLVVESCLSILESNRPSFPVIEHMLMTCAEIAFTDCRAINTTPNTGTDDDVATHITTCLANLVASFPEMKQFYEERETDNKQRFRDLRHYTNHVISHVEQGEGGTWCNILSENYDDNNNNCCKRSQIRIDFEDLPSFDEIVCAFCPLQMAVKIIISRKFGVEPTQQVICTADPENNNSEELLTDSSRTLEDIQQQQQDNNSNTNVVHIKVRIKSTTTIQEKDLKVVSTLGVGSYGTVFKCSFLHNAATSSSSSSERTSFVAVKALHEIIKSESNITRFQQEALISSRLRHPNVVRCLGTCITSTGSLWIVSELMELSLRQLLHHKDLTFKEVVAVSSGIAKGMSALHRRNIMHRDLSSNNVLLDSHGTPKITDFGVSRPIQNQIGCGWSKPAPTGSFTNGAGTPIYLPPQMHTGHYRIQGDMWEFSVLLSELLQREVPSVNTPKSSAQVTEFMRLQRASLSPPEIAEVDRLCDDVGDIPVAECLGHEQQQRAPRVRWSVLSRCRVLPLHPRDRPAVIRGD